MTDKLKRLIFPPRCAYCRRLLTENEQHICCTCQQKPYALGRPKAYKGPFYKNALAALLYDGDVRRALHRFKFHGGVHLAAFFALSMYKKLAETDWEFDLIVPVPSHISKRYKKGYDHARLLAQELSRLTGVPYKPLLKKTRRTKPMYGLRVSQRRANILDSVACTQALEQNCKRILLVDDIITTGCTMSECARVVKDAGAELVYGIAAAGIK